VKVTGLKKTAPTKAQLAALKSFLGRTPKAAETRAFFTVADLRRGAAIENLPAAGKGFPLLFVCQPRQGAVQGAMTVVQTRSKRVLGGNTFVLRRAKT
jgi:hypothetical protein